MSLLLHRLQLSLGAWPTLTDWGFAALLLVGFALLYLPIAFRVGFLQWQPLRSPLPLLLTSMQTLIYPGIAEEVLFRALPLPHPTEAIAAGTRWAWMVGIWLVFVAVHPLNPFERSGTFKSLIFLLGAGLLGAICTAAYVQSGSLWTAIALHTVMVVAWLMGLGGLAKLKFSLTA